MKLTQKDLDRCKIIYSSPKSNLYFSEIAPKVIIKRHNKDITSSNRNAQYDNEFNVTQKLDIKGIRQVYNNTKINGRKALLLEYFDGITIKEFLKEKSLPLDDLLKTIISFVKILEQVHKKNIIHKNLNSENILVNRKTFETTIIDFGNASEIEFSPIADKNIEYSDNELKYISPEQTGRISSIVDHRSDLFSIGIVMYEMLTQELPFNGKETSEHLYSLIAQNPITVSKLNKTIPETLSKIVSKLLSKNVEERYQSVYGLKQDLEICLDQFNSTGAIQEFQLANEDFTGVIKIPKKIFGRKNELKILKNAVDKALKNSIQVIFITGKSGVGKSCLVKEIYNFITDKRVYFISGNNSENQINKPYGSILNAFNEFIDLILTESSECLEKWKLKIKTSLGADAELVTELLPKLEILIGKPESKTYLSLAERQNKFNKVIKKFINTISQKESPLILFIDDLQWADRSTIDLLQNILVDTEIKHFLFIGSYRNNVIGYSHPLIKTINILLRYRISLNIIHLENLTDDIFIEFVAEILKIPPIKAKELSDIIFQKAGGNPLLFVQFLESLYSEKILKFNWAKKLWTWNKSAIIKKNVTDNIALSLEKKIKKLPSTSQELLSTAACIGNSFNLNLLASLTHKNQSDAYSDLRFALQEGFIVQLNGNYPLLNNKNNFDKESDCRFEFSHNRLREISLSLLHKKQKKLIHLKIARLLEEPFEDNNFSEKIYEIVNHYNEGFQYLENEDEKLNLAKLNLNAGLKAKLESAYHSAIWYFSMGIGILPPQMWESQFELTKTLYIEAIEAEYLSTNFERAELLSEEALKFIEDKFARLKIYEFQIIYYSLQNQNNKAIQCGIKALEILAINIPFEEADIKKRTNDLEKKLSNKIKDVSQLSNLPILKDSNQLAIRKILSDLILPLSQTSSPFLHYVISKLVLMTIKNGHSPESAIAYGWYAMIQSGHFNNIKRGEQFGKLSIAVAHLFSSTELEIKVNYLYNVYVNHWQSKATVSAKNLQNNYLRGMQISNLEYTYNSAVHYCGYSFFTGTSLEYLRQRQSEFLEDANRYRLEIHVSFLQVWSQTVSNLQSTENHNLEDDEIFNIDKMLPVWEKKENISLLFSALCSQILLNYFFGNYTKSIEIAKVGEKFAKGGEALIYNVYFNFYYSLSMLANYSKVDSITQQEYLNKVSEIIEKMKLWLEFSPINIENKYHLIQAERLRVIGEIDKTSIYYTTAINKSQEVGYLHEKGIAYQCEASFFYSIKRDELAELSINKAIECFQSWGAFNKVNQLKNKYQSNKKTYFTLDSNVILKSSRMLSEELKLEQLINKLMNLVIENAGAERGVLIEKRNDNLFIQAKRKIGNKFSENLLQIPFEECDDIPKSVINFVTRTHTQVVLSDAFNDNIFGSDEYINENKLKSILCIPILNQGRLSGIIYLENNLSTNIFTPERLELLKAISSQTAVSIENARFYNSLQQKVTELQRAEESLKENEEFLSSIVENIPNMIFVKEAKNLKFVRFNKAGENLLGLKRKELLGKSDLDFFPKEQAEFFYSMDKEVLKNKKLVDISEEPIDTKNGKRILHTKKIPLYDKNDNPAFLLGISEDITDRKRIQQALETSEELFRTLINAIPDVIIRTDINFNIVYANESVLRTITRLPIEKIVGKNILSFISEKDKNRAIKNTKLIFENKLGLREYKLIFDKDEEIDCEVNGEIIKNADGESTGVVYLFRDIRTRKKNEKELENYRLHLEELITERTNELEKVNKLLHIEIEKQKEAEMKVKIALEKEKELSDLKSQFISLASHEFRTPLTTVLSSTELLNRYTKEEFPEEHFQLIERIKNSVKHLTNLMDDVLTISRSETGKLSFEPIKTNIETICSDILDEIKFLITTNHSIKYLNKFEDIDILIDVKLFKFIAINLLTNAIKYSPEGGEITLSVNTQNNILTVEVIDNGIGIPEKDQPYLFEPFHRGSNVDDIRGTGLGMSIIKRSVEMHQGSIKFSSNVNKGSRFLVSLPYQEIKD